MTKRNPRRKNGRSPIDATENSGDTPASGRIYEAASDASNRGRNRLNETCLPISGNVHGFRHAACDVAPENIPAATPVVMIDHETEAEALNAGNPEAHTKALGILADFRKRFPVSKIGFYGMPFPVTVNDATRFRGVYGRIMARVDRLMPCLYVAAGESPAALVKRADAFRHFADGSGLEIIGVVSDWPIGSERACTDAEVLRQVEAAMAVGAKSLYVWSGFAWRARAVTQMAEHAEAGVPVSGAHLKLHADAMGMWGMTGPLTPNSVKREVIRISKGILGRFAKAIEAVGFGKEAK